MDTALVVGGTRFIGRHTVEEFLAHDYEVAIFNRGNHPNPFEADDRVRHVEGDRKNESALELARDRVEPDVVMDCVAYQPQDVRAAATIFRDVDAYVYVSSGGAYGAEEIPKREGETALKPCTDEQARDDAMETYGNRKAEGDRAVFEAARDGVSAMSVRPTVVYGPYDYTERMDYWIDRVASYDRVVVPGDGQQVWQRAYVEDVAAALRIVAEEGTAGEAYNVGDRKAVTLAEMVELVAATMDSEVEVVSAGDRELAAGGLSTDDYVLYRHYPHLLDTAKLHALGWESTPRDEAMARTVEESLGSDRDGSEYDPGRENEERVVEVLDTI
jgi:nucleoside-diphosphate-sugar epimerase